MIKKFLKKCFYYSNKIISNMRKFLLKNKDFTIISNNCWGGHVYRRYNLPYNSPTIGLFIMPSDYLKFIKNLDCYLNLDLKFLDNYISKYHHNLISYVSQYPKYPIGVLGDVEIHFLHYASKEEALNKWNRRKSRINRNKLIFKFCDQNLCEYKHLEEFDKLDYRHKICFTAKEYPELSTTTQLKEYENEGCVGFEHKYYTRYINIRDIINNL